tara:strand:+ start:361 stop:579 length:219 start_codon:yes stop_codon:yes gene_type:complete
MEAKRKMRNLRRDTQVKAGHVRLFKGTPLSGDQWWTNRSRWMDDVSDIADGPWRFIHNKLYQKRFSYETNRK